MKIEGPVPKVKSPSRTEFNDEFMKPQKPVVIVGANRQWKAHSAWTLEYLRNKIGSNPIRVKQSATNLYPDLFSGIPVRHAEIELSEYIDLIASDAPDRNKKYLSGDETTILSNYKVLNPILAPLCEDFEPPEYCDREKIKTIGFWLSAQGVVASLHYDNDGSHNLNIQVKGRKRVLLFPPHQGLYPFSGINLFHGAQNFSQVNILHPDEARFPAFRSAQCFEAVMEEGDMLFIPSYWYHAVFHEGQVNINVNFWWQPEKFHLNKTSFRATFLGLVQSALTGGKQFAEIREVRAAMEKLPAESRQLLQKIEDLIPQQYRI